MSTSVRQRGWVMRGGKPVEVEFEHGFSLTDGFPYCHEIGTWIPLSPFPAPSEVEVILLHLRAIENSIMGHRVAVQVLVNEKAKFDNRLYELQNHNA